ncbi:MAG: fatty acid desaturase [Phycisphaera sp.]|nr:fatty acid desaturase [Phycisphaera sp.]
MVHDGRLGAIEWRDLVPLTAVERVWELTLSVPWLVLSVWLYQRGWALPGATASFFFFLTGLRQSHNAQHYALGITRRAHDAMLFVLSVAMLSSMHAVQVTHLHHHRHCLDDDDVEAGHATWPWWYVLITGWWFPIHLTRNAWRLGTPGKRRWIAAELVAMVVWVLAVVCVLGVPGLVWHVAAMATGQCFTAFFAVWIVHRGCTHDGQIARTQRGWLKNLVSYAMFYHLEHHLFPAVPTCHLPRLAERLDHAAPELCEMNVY